MFSLRIISRYRPLITTTVDHLLRTPINCNTSLLPSTVAPVRHYAKGKDKAKIKARDKGVKFAKIQLTNDQLQEIIDLNHLNVQMNKALDTMKAEFIQNLSLRSTTGSIETLRVSVDGQDHELQELAQIVRKNPKTIVVNMASFPQTIPATLAALQKSGMNLNPQQDGTTIFIPVPKITKEHRENLSKNAKTLFIKCRDTIKDAQNQVIRKLKRQTDISQDENHSIQGHVIEIGDEFIAQAERLLEVKQKELVGDKE